MARFPNIRSTFFAKVLSWDERFRNREDVGTLLEHFMQRSGLSLQGVSGPRRVLQEVSLANVPSFFKPETSHNAFDFLVGKPEVCVGIRWEDPDWVELTELSSRLEVILRIQQDDFILAQQLFLLVCEITGAFWGELNQTAITAKVTFSGLNQHKSCLPLFGTMNYLGEDYTAFLGKGLEQAGFSRVRPWGKGVLTYIESGERTEFAEQQSRIRSKLGGDLVFDDWPADRGPCFVSRQHHVGRYRASLAPMEIRVTAKGLKKRLIAPQAQ